MHKLTIWNFWADQLLLHFCISRDKLGAVFEENARAFILHLGSPRALYKNVARKFLSVFSFKS